MTVNIHIQALILHHQYSTRNLIFFFIDIAGSNEINCHESHNIYEKCFDVKTVIEATFVHLNSREINVLRVGT